MLKHIGYYGIFKHLRLSTDTVTSVLFHPATVDSLNWFPPAEGVSGQALCWCWGEERNLIQEVLTDNTSESHTDISGVGLNVHGRVDFSSNTFSGQCFVNNSLLLQYCFWGSLVVKCLLRDSD